MASAGGRQALVSLLVNWSLCSINCLGFDPSIRYVIDDNIRGPYLEIDVHENECTSQAKHRTYYNKRCVKAAADLFGRHDRYFAASTNLESMDSPSVLIKDSWTFSDGDPTSNTCNESSVLNEKQAVFGEASELNVRFSRALSTGTVYFGQGNMLVKDTATKAFPELAAASLDTYNSQSRQHLRMVSSWIGNRISAADNPSQVIIAIADAMVTHNAVYVKCNILHGNISDQSIRFQKTANGATGILTGFGCTASAGDTDVSTIGSPGQTLFQSMRRKMNPRARCTRLDDWDSLLYVICMLGIVGINQTERDEFAADKSDCHPLKSWNTNSTADIFRNMRSYMDCNSLFDRLILGTMRHRALRQLAKDIHGILFSGQRYTRAETVDNERDPRTLRDDIEDVIVTELLSIVARHKQETFATLSNNESTTAVVAEVNAVTPKKRKRIVAPTTSPMMTRPKTNRSAPEI